MWTNIHFSTAYAATSFQYEVNINFMLTTHWQQ